MPQKWAVFCVAIDNFGDIGVCWRLARQLHEEYAAQVDLWVDDWQSLGRFLRLGVMEGKEFLVHQRVQLHRWHRDRTLPEASLRILETAEVVIEAFACTLPDEVLCCMASASPAPLWFNLDYLSAESWVRDCHLLDSPQTVTGRLGQPQLLHKRFFFPGFGAGTGGLLREQGLQERHARWQAELARNRRELLLPLGLPAHWLEFAGGLFLSLFGYEGRAARSLLKALEEGPEPTVCLVPEGRSLLDVAAHFGLDEPPVAGTALSVGALHLLVLPFLSQENYDRLLSVCDCNFVRGEDSFVRAQHAGRPLVWQLYPQEENAHLEKMEAFLQLYEGAGPGMEALLRFWRHWNLDEDCRELWHHLRPQLPTLQRQARNWQQQLANWPDLAANLVQACRGSLAP